MALANIGMRPQIHAGFELPLSLLRQRFGDRFTTGEAARIQHGHTLTWIPNQPPDAVIFPESAEEVSQIVTICAEHRMPVIAYGAGSSLEGHLNAPFGGVCLDMSRMNRVLAIHAEDMDCEVEAGITRKQLNAALRDTGLFFAVDPGADATLGGMAATRASGTNAVRYGTMRETVLNLTAVMADGRIVKTARRARKSSAGYDLTRLLVGSEGTLGIITALTVRLYALPESVVAAVCPFPSLEAACATATAAVQLGLGLARIELLDADAIRACNLHSKLSMAETPTLFLEFHGTRHASEEQVRRFEELAAGEGGGPFRWATQTEERNRLWQARHDAYWAARALRPGASIMSTDVCVPVSRLAECVRETQDDIARLGLIAPILGHVGDGNFHVLPLIDVDNPAEIAKVRELNNGLVQRALRLDGTCTGEHGIGSGKKAYLRDELGDAVEIMAAIKRSLDPLNILNPGKIFDPVREQALRA
jgi:D-lactate dehydrogenase (cytochrome)